MAVSLMQNFKTLALKTKELLRFKVKVAQRIARAEKPAYRRSLRSLKKVSFKGIAKVMNKQDPFQ